MSEQYFIAIGALAWCMCGVADAGLMYAYWQRRFHLIANEKRSFDTFFSIALGLFGPLSLVSTIFGGYANYEWLCPGRRP